MSWRHGVVWVKWPKAVMIYHYKNFRAKVMNSRALGHEGCFTTSIVDCVSQ
jgi:hypothetical protein